MTKKTKRFIVILLGSIVLFAFLFHMLNVYCYIQNKKLCTYEFEEGHLDTTKDGLGIEVSVSKQWQDIDSHPGYPVGAQYDGVIHNDSQQMFRDWTLVMNFSEVPVIDSSWNGDFAVDDKTITVVCIEDSAIADPHGKATFGAVINSKKILRLNSAVLQGYRIVEVKQLFMYKILVALAWAWALTLLVYVIVSIQTRQYRQRQELDTKIIKQSISTFTGFIDAKDKYTRGHSSRVADYSAEIAKRIKLSEEEVAHIYQIGLMHDCGKIGIPDEILKKPGPLKPEEYEVVKSHTTLGDALLKNFTAIPEIREGAHYHHERYDGKGYPSGLVGKDIPLCARIICIADSYDAMSSNRCYRKQLTYEQIVSELKENAGKQFDPELVPIMLEMMEDGFTAKIRDKDE